MYGWMMLKLPIKSWWIYSVASWWNSKIFWTSVMTSLYRSRPCQDLRDSWQPFPSTHSAPPLHMVWLSLSIIAIGVPTSLFFFIILLLPLFPQATISVPGQMGWGTSYSMHRRKASTRWITRIFWALSSGISMILLADQWLKDSVRWMCQNSLASGGAQHLSSALFPSMRWVQFNQTAMSICTSPIYISLHIPLHFLHSSKPANPVHERPTSLQYFSWHCLMLKCQRRCRRCLSSKLAVHLWPLLLVKWQHPLSFWSTWGTTSSHTFRVMGYSRQEGHLMCLSSFMEGHILHCWTSCDHSFPMLNLHFCLCVTLRSWQKRALQMKDCILQQLSNTADSEAWLGQCGRWPTSMVQTLLWTFTGWYFQIDRKGFLITREQLRHYRMLWDPYEERKIWDWSSGWISSTTGHDLG